MLKKKITIQKRKPKKRCSFHSCKRIVTKWEYLFKYGKLLCLQCACLPETEPGYVEGQENVKKVYRKKVKKKVVKAPAYTPKKKTKPKK